jgi:hypothetical protein
VLGHALELIAHDVPLLAVLLVPQDVGVPEVSIGAVRRDCDFAFPESVSPVTLVDYSYATSHMLVPKKEGLKLAKRLDGRSASSLVSGWYPRLGALGHLMDALSGPGYSQPQDVIIVAHGEC